MRARLPEGATVDVVEWPRAHEWARTVKAGLSRLPPEQAKFEWGYLAAQLRLYEFYGATPWLVTDEGGTAVGLHVARPASGRRKNAWGLYVNHYLAFVRPEVRRMGYGAGAEAELQHRWSATHDRLKTLCQSRLGVYYHESLADQVWGVNEKGELVIDSPLDPNRQWPEGVPMKARSEADEGRTAPLTPAELMPIVTDPAGRFRMDEAEAEALFERRVQESNLQGREPRPS